MSYKIVDPSLASTIKSEKTAEPYAVFSMDLDIGGLKSVYGIGNTTKEYSYMVAASTYNYDDDNGTYYEYTALLHPLMNSNLLNKLVWNSNDDILS